MYFNNVHILIYVGFALLGLIIGKFIAWINMRIPEKKKVFTKEFFKINKQGLEKNYIIMITIAVLYIALLYKFGIKDEIAKNLDLIKFLFLIPMLVSSFFIDIKHRILPNRLNLTMFQIGLIFTFIYGITNINMAKDMIFGMFTGAGIFVILTFVGRLITGKESMGFGDVKFMGALGLYFGVSRIAEIVLSAFFISAACSVIILIIRVVVLKSEDEYIPFGPFLSISAILSIFLPTNFIYTLFIALCTGISNKIVGVIN